ncbi:unnamed protein product [Arctia plantaginis]|uniref:Uncharacterized protein n=1 Tax=Arctia plantaginis TaxID=874455 RepID=A0A8S1A625_ARCPL|nr:unnamed protein product [Arctia plantaginis]
MSIAASNDRLFVRSVDPTSKVAQFSEMEDTSVQPWHNTTDFLGFMLMEKKEKFVQDGLELTSRSRLQCRVIGKKKTVCI